MIKEERERWYILFLITIQIFGNRKGVYHIILILSTDNQKIIKKRLKINYSLLIIADVKSEVVEDPGNTHERSVNQVIFIQFRV